MAIYIIGDVHGCWRSLQALLDKINYHPQNDSLCFMGDIVSRGPSSLDVLRFVLQNDNIHCVYGNHDLWTLAIAYGCLNQTPDSSIAPLLQADDLPVLLDGWRLKSKLLITLEDDHAILVHAGIPPCWSISQAQQLAQETEAILHSNDHYQTLLEHMKGNLPALWSNGLRGLARYRYILNAFTRMRICRANGELDFKENTSAQSSNSLLKPWFAWPHSFKPFRVFYGHWATLGAGYNTVDTIGTDTGCMWGGKLSAYRLNGNTSMPTLIQVENQDVIDERFHPYK